MAGGSTLRSCTQCSTKINCANRRCTKCGKLLDIKSRQTARMTAFRAKAREWAQKVRKSRNQAKIFDNSALLVEKLKALGYFPLLLWGKYIPQNKKWRAQLQCPFELPVAAHAVLERIACLFENLLEACDLEREEEVVQLERTGEEDEAEIVDEGQSEGEQQRMGETGRLEIEEMEGDEEETVDGEEVERVEIEGQKELGVVETVAELEQQERTGEEHEEAQKDRAESEKLERGEIEMEEMEADKEREQTVEVGKKVKNKVEAASRKPAVKISAKRKRKMRQQSTDDVCQYHSTLDVFPVQYIAKTREKKGRKEVLVHWLPCPSCQKAWPPSWELQENIEMTLS